MIAAAGKSIAGAIPVAGPLLSELIDYLIPDQRIDRLARYISELESKLSHISEEIVRETLKSEENISLAEDGFIHASRAISKERTSYIASIVANGLSDAEIEAHRQKYLLNLLSEINDEEIIWLRMYLHPEISGDHEFREKHKVILAPASASMDASEKELDKYALQESYKDHLERLGLVRPNIRVDRTTKIPEFDSRTGKPKKSSTDITHLGRMLLREIGLVDVVDN
nr:hypothetical protein [Pseudohongiella sp. O18]